jgi:hypothetical protein
MNQSSVSHTRAVIELIDRAETFCSKVEAKLADAAPLPPADDVELRGKLGLCRNQIAHLQSLNDHSITNAEMREGLRHLIIAMMWVAFYARAAIDYKIYRMLLTVESTFTYLLMKQVPKFETNGGGFQSEMPSS